MVNLAIRVLVNLTFGQPSETDPDDFGRLTTRAQHKQGLTRLMAASAFAVAEHLSRHGPVWPVAGRNVDNTLAAIARSSSFLIIEIPHLVGLGQRR